MCVCVLQRSALWWASPASQPTCPASAVSCRTTSRTPSPTASTSSTGTTRARRTPSRSSPRLGCVWGEDCVLGVVCVHVCALKPTSSNSILTRDIFLCTDLEFSLSLSITAFFIPAFDSSLQNLPFSNQYRLFYFCQCSWPCVCGGLCVCSRGSVGGEERGAWSLTWGYTMHQLVMYISEHSLCVDVCSV